MFSVAAWLSALWTLAVAGSAAAFPSNCSQSGSTVTCSYTGAGNYPFTVPARVSSLELIAVAPASAAVALPATVVPTAETTAKAHRHVRRHHRHHHRRTTAVPASARGGCAYADAPATSASRRELRAAVVCLINRQRNSRGLPSLRASTELNRSAQSWNLWMVATGNFTHGSNFGGRISAVGYDWQAAGENVATGFATAREVVSAWMASPGHCRNILDPSFRDIGTGVTAAAVRSAASQPSTWTNDFGLLISQRPPSGKTGPQNGCPY